MKGVEFTYKDRFTSKRSTDTKGGDNMGEEEEAEEEEEEEEEEEYDMYVWCLDFNPLYVKAKTEQEAKELFLKWLNEHVANRLFDTGDAPEEFGMDVGEVEEEEEEDED